MKFSIQKETLLSLLNEHSKVVPLRTTLPILSCACIQVEKNKAIIKTSNLDQTITSTTEIVDEEEGSIAVPISKLTEIITALPKEEIKITTNDDFLMEINSKSGVYKITGRSADEFPEKEKNPSTGTVSLPGKELADIIERTTYATSKDDLKPALTGVYFNIKKGEITAVATDGHKLVKFIKKAQMGNSQDQSIIIPAKFLTILKNIIKEDKDIIINIDQNSISTEQKNFLLTSRIINENFPDFNSVIPSSNPIEATIKSEEFLACIKRVSIFSNRNQGFKIILNFNASGVVVSAEDPETSTSAKEHFNCEYKGEELTTSYNAKYLSETIQHINTDKIKIYLNSALSAALIMPEDQKENEELTALLMPLRIN